MSFLAVAGDANDNANGNDNANDNSNGLASENASATTLIFPEAGDPFSRNTTSHYHHHNDFDFGRHNQSQSFPSNGSCCCCSAKAGSEAKAEAPRGGLSFGRSEALEPEFLAFVLGILTIVGSVVAFFVQRSRERRERAEADKKAASNLDRKQALERVRNQLGVFVGPLHRLYKTHNTILGQYRLQSGTRSDRMSRALRERGRALWMTVFDASATDKHVAHPHTREAVLYRNMVSRRLRPIYTRIRELVLAHSSDLADMPTQDEWLEKHDTRTILSPYVGSINVNVILDTFSVWSLEFDDIVVSWEEGDFGRMQPLTEVNWLLCNDLVDALYDTAKAKEASYNKHVKVHKNEIQSTTIEEMERNILESLETRNDHQSGATGEAKAKAEGHQGGGSKSLPDSMPRI